MYICIYSCTRLFIYPPGTPQEPPRSPPGTPRIPRAPGDLQGTCLELTRSPGTPIVRSRAFLCWFRGGQFDIQNLQFHSKTFNYGPRTTTFSQNGQASPHLGLGHTGF